MVMAVIENATIDIDSTGQERYTLNEEQLGKVVDSLGVHESDYKHLLEEENEFMIERVAECLKDLQNDLERISNNMQAYKEWLDGDILGEDMLDRVYGKGDWWLKD